MLRLLGKIAAGAALILSVNSVANAEEYDPAYVRIGVGAFDVFEDTDKYETVTFSTEYISGDSFFHLKPFFGLMGNGDKAGYVYAGVRYDWEVADNWVIAPSFAPGFYTDGDSKDLGYALEFRSAIEVAYEFENRSRVGVSLYHLSNAGLGDDNPGTEVVTLHYSHPVEEFFGYLD